MYSVALEVLDCSMLAPNFDFDISFCILPNNMQKSKNEHMIS